MHFLPAYDRMCVEGSTVRGKEDQILRVFIPILFVTILAVQLPAWASQMLPASVTHEVSATTETPVSTTATEPDNASAIQQSTLEDTSVNTAVGEGGDFSDFASLDLAALLNTEVDLGTGFKRKLSELPAVVEVYTAEEIARLGVRDLRELMKHMTGMYETAIATAPFITNTVLLRGGNVSDRILLMIDDHVALDELDETYNPWGVPIDMIERVEYLRGPAAVLYGSSSMAGVVRIITKKHNGKGGGGGGGLVTYDPVGHGGEVYAHAGWQGDSVLGEELNVRLDVQARQTEEYGNAITPDQFGLASFHPLQTSYVTAMGIARLGDLYLRGQFHIGKASLLGLAPSSLFHARVSRRQLIGAEIDYAPMLGKWRLKLRQAIDVRNRDLNIGELPPGNRKDETNLKFDGMVLESEASLARQGDSWSLKGGLQNRYLRTSTVAFLLVNQNNLLNALGTPAGAGGWINDANLFGQATWQPVIPLEFLGGVRLNLYKTKAENFTGLSAAEANPAAKFSPMFRGAVVWSALKQLSVKALYGRAFRLPSMIEMYSQVRTVIDPNPLLEPEIQDTVELAVDTTPLEGFSLRVNGFLNVIRNGISSSDDGSGFTGGNQYKNSKLTYHTAGFDLTAKWIGSRWWNGYLSFTYQEGGMSNGAYLAEMPRVVSKAWLSLFPLGSSKLVLTPVVFHRGKIFEIAPETWFNLTVRYQVLDWMLLQVSSFNLLNTRLTQPYYSISSTGVPVNGDMTDTRTLRLTVEAKF